jgi:hypothetical protein
MWQVIVVPSSRVAHAFAFGIAKRAVFAEWRVAELWIV